MLPHTTIHETVMRDRVAELRRVASANAHIRGETRRHARVAAARYGVGWLLVDMGLRLATPRGAASYRAARGQR